MYGTIEKPDGLDPKGEFFCKHRESWMPEIPGKVTYVLSENDEVDLL